MPPRKGELEPPRRFYAKVDVESLAGSHIVRLDGRGARTPLGKPLAAPTRRLAELIAAEWAAQGEHIDFGSMPATRLLHTALDGVSETRVLTEKSVVDYLGSDLICYLAEGPATLVERQRSIWSPLLAWADEALGLSLVQTAGIVHRELQPQNIGINVDCTVKVCGTDVRQEGEGERGKREGR